METKWGLSIILFLNSFHEKETQEKECTRKNECSTSLIDLLRHLFDGNWRDLRCGGEKKKDKDKKEESAGEKWVKCVR